MGVMHVGRIYRELVNPRRLKLCLWWLFAAIGDVSVDGYNGFDVGSWNGRRRSDAANGFSPGIEFQ